jgi:hypothetical protein
MRWRGVAERSNKQEDVRQCDARNTTVVLPCAVRRWLLRCLLQTAAEEGAARRGG